MMRSAPQLTLVLLGSLFACSATQPPPATPQDSEEPPAEPVATENAAPEEPPVADESWEGEDLATAALSNSRSASNTGGSATGGADLRSETRTTEVIALVIRENRKQFRDCYEQGARDLPDLQGTLTLHFILDGQGKVKQAELNRERSTIHAPPVVDCALSLLRTLSFPPSSRGMESTVNYPFDFKR